MEEPLSNQVVTFLYMLIKQEDGTEIEVYTADEVKTQIAAKETEFGTVKTQLEKDLEEARKANLERAGEFKQFRKLRDEDLVKLSEAERTIYNNGLLLEEERVKRVEAEGKILTSQIDTAIGKKAGTDEKLITKIKEMWPLIGIEAVTPEQIEQKVNMIIGAIGATSPDLIASVQGFNGGFAPPVTQKKDGESHADTDAGKTLGADLGLTLEKKA